MLKQRIITAAILLPVVMASILWLPNSYFALFFAVIASIGSWEWAKFMRIGSVALPMALRILYVALVSLFILVCWNYVIDVPKYNQTVLAITVAWWALAFVLVIIFPGAAWFRKNIVMSGLVGLIVLVPTWLAIVSLRNNHIAGIELLLYLLVIIVIADTGAYFGGKKWGKNKLAPKVSPGKSWEGVVSGMVCVSLVAMVYTLALDVQQFSWTEVWFFVGVSLVTAVFSVVGDLTESLYKREAGLKDSGSILPGHGGVLDRIDSLTAASPVFLFCLSQFYF